MSTAHASTLETPPRDPAPRRRTPAYYRRRTLARTLFYSPMIAAFLAAFAHVALTTP
ncbi:hypothetical protein MRBLMI12_000454 [Microbacterium sp. LMI12-1-1.1]|uniref:hypothetical protein n=1 Tax=Microbacterium sp. LMI12-1-1.1 TaxID=3135225 RepID=UPI003432F2D6